MKKKLYDVCEYDNYPIPAYDPTIPDDERERRKAEAIKALDEVIQRTTNSN